MLAQTKKRDHDRINIDHKKKEINALKAQCVSDQESLRQSPQIPQKNISPCVDPLGQSSDRQAFFLLDRLGN